MRLEPIVLLLLASGCGCAETPPPATPDRAEVTRMGLAALEYGQQFVVVCAEDRSSRFRYPGPACPQVEGMSFDIHRDSWASSYLNYDDPNDPANAGPLARQTYISLQLADLAGYKALGLLKAHEVTRDPAFLERFRRSFLRPIRDKELPSAALGLGKTQTFQAAYAPDPQRDVTLDATGSFASSATVAAGADGVLGTADDVLTWRWNGYSGFQFAALVEALATYAARTREDGVLAAVDSAGRFLLRLERRTASGEGEGCWPYGVAPANGPPNRMTTGIVSRALMTLSRMEALPGSREFRAGARRGAEWLRQQPPSSVDPVSAGAELEVLLDAGQVLPAVAAAQALLARMTTPEDLGWGDHRYASDPHALGGIASSWGTGSLQSPWFATYAVAGLLALGRVTGNGSYTTAADLVVRWLGDKVSYAQRHQELVHVQDLRGGVAPIRGGTWWGLLPEAYEPNAGTFEDRSHVSRKTTPNLILGWVSALNVDLAQRPTSWLEQRLGLDFERMLHDRVRADPYLAHITTVYPWHGWTDEALNLGDVGPAINPLLADDAALALLDYARLRWPRRP